jgi:hypothetical protein
MASRFVNCSKIQVLLRAVVVPDSTDYMTFSENMPLTENMTTFL